MTKAAIYLRVSTEEQAREGISLDAQKQRCSAFCVAKGWEIHEIYTDAGYSAGSLKRPALKRMFKEGRESAYDVLLVYKIDRFSRNLKDLVLVLEDLKSQHINFSSVTEQIDTTTAMGEAFFQIIGVFAQLERGMVKERVELAFDKKISDGQALHRPPLGYVFENNQLMVDNKTSHIVKEIFFMRAAGISYKEICKKFNIPVSTFYEILKNPIYTGKIKYRGELYSGSHTPIISEELFNKNQRRSKL